METKGEIRNRHRKAIGGVVSFRVILIALVLIAVGCSDDASGPNDDQNGGVGGVIGPEGGVLEITDPESPIYGVRVEIPPLALVEATEIRILESSTTPASPLQQKADLWSIVVSLEPKGLEFNEQVSITLPYRADPPTDPLSLFVTRTNESNESFCLITQNVEVDVSRVTTSTLRSGLFSVWTVKTDSIWQECDTPFKLEEDVLSISNFAPGRCAGMCDLALWYYSEKKQEYGSLRGRRSSDGEKELANNAHSGIGPSMGFFMFPPDDDPGYRLARATQIQLRMDPPHPTMLLVRSEELPPGHCVIADAVDLSEPGYVVFKVYDPNYPSEWRSAYYSLGTRSFTYVIDEAVGPQPVIGYSPEAYKPTQMNTVLHAGAWEYTYTITEHSFPPPLLEPPVLVWASPCTLDIAPGTSEASQMAVNVRMPPPVNPINEVWMRGNILGKNLILNGEVEFWYVFIDPDDGSFHMGQGRGVLEYLIALFANDQECEGNFKVSGTASELELEVWYRGTFTGCRPPAVPPSQEMSMWVTPLAAPAPQRNQKRTP